MLTGFPLILAQEDTPPASGPSIAPAPGGPVVPAGPSTGGETVSSGVADPARTQPRPSDGPSQFLPLILLLVIAVFWIFMTSSQRKEKKRRQAMLDNLKKGDKVLTIGGIFGSIVEIRDQGQEILVKVDENTNARLRFSRNAIQSVIEDKAEKAE